MPREPSPSAPAPAAVTARLRAAGCVFAEDEARLLAAAAPTPEALAEMVERRAAGLPLEHVLGWAEFCGLRIAVVPGVFVPRARTEFLAGRAAAVARGIPGPRRIVVVDMCCGSGAVGAALAAAVEEIEVHACDIDPAAAGCARRNLGARGRVYEGDLFAPLPRTLRGRVDIVVANAPYVPTDAIVLMPAEARIHEPRAALDGGPDGLDVVRRVAAAAPAWLRPGGRLLVETSEGQAAAALAAVAGAGLVPQIARSDELDATVVTGSMPEPRP
jgi:release factor glutamine methyltransferase